MDKLAPNPFKFGNPVQGDFYLPRPELAATLRQFLENRIHIVLMGPRRFGKTSFVLSLFNQLERDGYTCLFVDIFNITSHKDFLHQLLRAIRSRKSLQGTLKSLWGQLKRLGPQVSADFDAATGSSSFSLSLTELKEEDVQATIQDLLEGLARLGKKVVIALDEFQKISEIGDQGWLEATLRTHFQTLKNVSFLFTGSRKSLISEMLNDPARPLYRSCQLIDFPTFGKEFTDWVVERFSTVGLQCEREAIDHLRELVQDIPNYVQMVCFHLVAQARSNIGVKDVEEVLKSVARQNVYSYQTLMNSLTLAQQRTLRLAATEKQSLFHKDFLEKYEITSPAALSSSINALKSKGILDKEGTVKGKVLFDDPLLALWLRLSFNS